MNTQHKVRVVRRMVSMGIVVAVLGVGPALATDFSGYTTDELLQMRQQNEIRAEDREAFRAELQSRMQSMTPEERMNLRQEYGFGQGTGQAESGQRMGQGRGRGRGHDDGFSMNGGGRGGRGRGHNRWR